MAVNTAKYREIINQLEGRATLVAVSKIQSIDAIKALYKEGQRDFGENYVQEVLEKYEHLPKDIRWHYIGHLQRNKVKYIAPFIHLIHGVDSEKLLAEINKEAKKNNRVVNCLLQVHIAEEETKFGFSEKELFDLADRVFVTKSVQYPNVAICGLMGMASFSDALEKVRHEFKKLKDLYATLYPLTFVVFQRDVGALEKQDPDEVNDIGTTFYPPPSTFNTLSMGMSGDYSIALEEGSNMVRIGSLIFGQRIG